MYGWATPLMLKSWNQVIVFYNQDELSLCDTNWTKIRHYPPQRIPSVVCSYNLCIFMKTDYDMEMSLQWINPYEYTLKNGPGSKVTHFLNRKLTGRRILNLRYSCLHYVDESSSSSLFSSSTFRYLRSYAGSSTTGQSVLTIM